jgi:LPS sulfotransferase NodH
MTIPTSSYLICATPRSGSTLLCDLLERTGVAGHPAEHFETLPETGRPRQPEDYLGQVYQEVREILGGCPRTGETAEPEPIEAVLERGTTPNGMFGTKVMWPYLEGLAWRLGHPAPDYRALRETFPRLRLVHSSRRDRVRQGISLWRAVQTWSWRHEPSADRTEPVFHRGAIERLARLLDDEDAAWERFFAESGVEPVRVVYEDLAADPRGTIARVLDALDLPVPPDAGTRTALARQADELSEDWAARCL